MNELEDTEWSWAQIRWFLWVCRSVCGCQHVFALQYVSIGDCVCCLRGEPPLSNTEVELAELMERFHVNAAKYSSLICRDSPCSMLLLLKTTLRLHTLTFTVLWDKKHEWREDWPKEGKLKRSTGKRRGGCVTRRRKTERLQSSLINWQLIDSDFFPHWWPQQQLWSAFQFETTYV